MSDHLPVSVPSPNKPPLFGVPPSIELNVSAQPGHSGTVVVAHDPRRYRLWAAICGTVSVVMLLANGWLS